MDASIKVEAVHLRAIRDEIGDRLRELLRRETGRHLPPHLSDLMEQLASADREVIPSIVPSLEDIIVEPGQMPRIEVTALAMAGKEPA